MTDQAALLADAALPVGPLPAGSKLRILVVAFSARFALEQLVDAFGASLLEGSGTSGAETRVMVPTHYRGGLPEAALLRIACGASKLGGVAAGLNPAAHVQVLSALRRFRPDVIHVLSGEGYPWAVTLAEAARRRRIPLVVTIHDPDPHPGNLVERLNAVIRRAVLARADALQIYSEQHRKRVGELARGGARIAVIPHGSFAGRYLAHRREGVERERLVLFFGRFQYYKGIDVLCRAAALLAPDVRLVLAGPGALSEAEQALIVGLGARVELHNAYLDDAQVAVLMQRARVLALPYRHVTQSSVPAIAAAFGLRIVASALGHFVEEVPALGGILVAPEDPQALADGIAHALTASGVERVTPPPSFADLAPSFLTLYASVVATRGRDPGLTSDQG